MDIELEKQTICKGYILGILYDRFGYTVKLLTVKNGSDIFRLLSKAKLSRDGRNPEMYSHDRRILKGEIMFSLTEDNYNSVGLFNEDELIGISFSSVIEEENQPWLGYFYIKDTYRNSKASVVLINYLINHLYKGFIIQMGDTDTQRYGKLISHVPIMEYSVFNNGVAERFAKVCKDPIIETKDKK